MNLTEAITWYRQAAKGGHAEAQYVLASLYDHGEGVEPSENTAVKWYGEAAAQGVAEAQLILADCYLRGRGVPTDYVMAYIWFNYAASQGISIADQYRMQTERFMSLDQIAQAQEMLRGRAA